MKTVALLIMVIWLVINCFFAVKTRITMKQINKMITLKNGKL